MMLISDTDSILRKHLLNTIALAKLYVGNSYFIQVPKTMFDQFHVIEASIMFQWSDLS